MNASRRFHIVVYALLSGGLFAGPARGASIQAGAIPSQGCYVGSVGNGQKQIQGFQFTPTTDLLVTSLGLFDCGLNGPNGINLNTPVGLYVAGDSTPLIAATIPSGTGATLIGSVRYVNVTPVILQAGVEYTLLSYQETGNGEPVTLSAGATIDPRITINQFVATQSPDFTGLQDYAAPFCCEIFGPDFQFEVATPEPGSLALTGFAAAVLLCLRRRRFVNK